MRQNWKLQKKLEILSLHTFSLNNYDNDYVIRGESHDTYELVCVLNGSIGITAGTDVFTLSAGNAILHPPMEFHSFWSAGGTSPTVISFSFIPSRFPKLTGKTFSFGAIEKQLLLDALDIAQYALEFNGQTIIGIRESQELHAQRLLESLTLVLLHLFTGDTPGNLPAATHGTQSYVKITSYIHTNLEQIQSVPQIAAACGLSEIGVQKIFHKYAGTGVISYVNHLKITRAIQMLEDGYSNKAISLALGFANQNYFSTVFKRITGTSPTQYVKQK